VPLRLMATPCAMCLLRYNFEGSWPDKYMRELTGLERAVHYWQAVNMPTEQVQ
jgi:hypothetical protein